MHTKFAIANGVVAGVLALGLLLTSGPACAQSSLQLVDQTMLPLAKVRVVAGDPHDTRVALSDGMSKIVMADADGVLWEHEETQWVTDMAFAQPNLLLVATGGADVGGGAPELVIHHVADGRVIARVAGAGGMIAVGGGTLVVAGGHGAIRLVREDDQWVSRSLYRHPVEAVAVSDDGFRMALVDRNATSGRRAGEAPRMIRLFTLDETGITAVASLRGHTQEVAALAFAGDSLVSADFDGNVRWWPRGATKSTLIADDFCRHDDPGTRCRLWPSSGGNLLAGPFGNTVLRRLPSGTAVDTAVVIAQQGPARVTWTGHDQLVWAGKPPTFPASVLRWWTVVEPTGSE